MTKKKRIYHSAGKTRCPHVKETEILFYATHPKINFKWMKDLSLGLDTIKIPEENIGNKLLDISLDNNFLDLTPKTNAIKAKINKVGLYQVKKLLHSKGKHRQS